MDRGRSLTIMFCQARMDQCLFSDCPASWIDSGFSLISLCQWSQWVSNLTVDGWDGKSKLPMSGGSIHGSQNGVKQDFWASHLSEGAQSVSEQVCD